ncbi:MAG: hypothetical protein J7J87_03770 [Candidatus Diapherotrites archaeon]|nr:hypothetical protein [Candidatus Diapherotrites archaeon]
MEKGVSPIIGALLLLLITVAIGFVYFTWIYGYTVEETTKARDIGSQSIDCSEAGITIISCSYDKGNTEVVSVGIENTGSVDLNGFKVVAIYTDYDSDVNDNEDLYLDVGASGIAYITANASKTVSEVKVIPLECDNISDKTTSCS